MARAALLLIDVQQGLDEPALGQRNNPQAEANMVRLLHHWRNRGLPVIHIQHCSVEPNSPLRPGQPGNQFKPGFEPMASEPVFQKTVNSAFIGTALDSHLRDNEITHLVIVGLTTDHCVSSSTRMAGNLGFSVILVSDATATFDRIGPDGNYYSAEQMHQVNLASLNGEFCQVLSTNAVIAS